MSLNTVQEHLGVPWDGRTPYERWVEVDQGLTLHRGYAAGPFGTAPVEHWALKGINAAFYDIIGGESLAGMYVGEIPPGESSTQVRQLFDEVIYVISGSGSTSMTTADGTRSFEWGPRSLFGIPINCLHQMHNASGSTPVRFLSVNTLPILYSLFRDQDFLFGGTDWDFKRLPKLQSANDAVLYKPDSAHSRTAVDLYETLFVPDITAVPRSRFAERGEGARTVYFELANSPISVHVAAFGGGTFFNPHKHGPSAYVFTLDGSGYSLMWPEGGEMVRFDWPRGDVGVVVPPNQWWHGHFITSPTALHIAIKLRSRKHPVNHLFDKTHKLVSEGGTVLRYQDLEEGLRDRIWSLYVEECAQNGMEARLTEEEMRATMKTAQTA